MRLRVVSIGHTAEVRHADAVEAQAKMDSKIKELTAMVGRAFTTGPSQPGTTGPASSGSGPRPESSSEQPDPSIVRANTHVPATLAQVQHAMGYFLQAHTSIDPELVRIAGPPCSRIEEIMRELRDRHRVLRELDVALTGGGKTRLYVGSDRPRAQVQMEITGKRREPPEAEATSGQPHPPGQAADRSVATRR